MCGIVGIIDKTGISEINLIKKMNDSLKHRGPDDEGYLVYNSQEKVPLLLSGDDSVVKHKHIDTYKGKANILLGHRRLSIIDTSPMGHQPMGSEDFKTWVVFNGEIYNYIELRGELKHLGYNFQTGTDTEVLLKAYQEFGVNCTEKFNGMWAFAILDLERNILFFSRDLPGVKPFYYIYKEGSSFIFASEVKAFLRLPQFDAKINPKKVMDYLAFSLVDDEEETFLSGVYQLMPGYSGILDLSDFKLKLWNHRKITYNSTYEKFSEDKVNVYSKTLKEKIFNAVNLRLRSDVAVGSCLSGGVDSSTIVMVVNEIIKKSNIEQIGEKQKVFTASFRNTNVDETHWAEKVVKAGKIEWYTVNPTFNELLEDLQDLIYYQDFPFPTTSIYAQYRVMELAKENGVTVTLDGQGGDEVFGGYLVYYGPFTMEIMRNRDFSQLIQEIRNLKNSPISFGKLLQYLVFSEMLSKMPKLASKLFRKQSSIAYLQNHFLKEYFSFPINLLNKFKTDSGLNDVLALTYKESNLASLLRFADRNSMRFSIESRVPFADDKELIDYVFSIPSVYKIHNGYSKYILRIAMEGIVPEENLWRVDKKGFETPETVWFKDNLETIIRIVYSLEPYLRDYINTTKLIKDLKDKKLSSLRFVWKAINLGKWIEITKRKTF